VASTVAAAVAVLAKKEMGNYIMGPLLDADARGQLRLTAAVATACGRRGNDGSGGGGGGRPVSLSG